VKNGGRHSYNIRNEKAKSISTATRLCMYSEVGLPQKSNAVKERTGWHFKTENQRVKYSL